MSSGNARHAVVIGSGIGGLLAARVLAKHFDRVTVLDRDRFPATPDHRGGVPQSHHVHGLLPSGAALIAALFPGLVEELRADGATPTSPDAGMKVVTPAGLLPAPQPPGGGLLFSRFLLEWRLRERVAALAGVTLVPDSEVVGLDADPTSGRVRGVRIRHRHATPPPATRTDGAPGDQPSEPSAGRAADPPADRPATQPAGHLTNLPADLVVDSSGRSSKAPNWLRDLGYGDVTEETVNSGLGYASRFYAKPDDFPHDWDVVIVNGRPPDNPRAGLVTAIENDRWHVTLAGIAGAQPPTDEAGFQQWARDLADPSVYEAVRVARPLGPIRGWRTPTNRLRRFERLDRWPVGFITTGDAVCAFNPIYGQGMTVAAMDAFVLRAGLREHDGGRAAGFERAFQKSLARTLATPWLIATSEDLRWPGITLTGASPSPTMAPIRRYLDLVLRCAVHDPYLAGRYAGLITMTAHPRTLFTPGVLARVARHVAAGRHKISPQRFALSPAALAAARALPDFDHHLEAETGQAVR